MEIGTFEVDVKLHPESTATVTVEIISSVTAAAETTSSSNG